MHFAFYVLEHMFLKTLQLQVQSVARVGVYVCDMMDSYSISPPPPTIFSPRKLVCQREGFWYSLSLAC